MSEWIVATIKSLGYVGIGVLMFLENLFPPIPSELIMPLAGFTVAQGKMSLVGAIIAGVIGTILGAYPWYYIGKFISEERLKELADHYGRWLGLSHRDIEKADRWFNRYGVGAVFFGRLIPGVRTLISLPAGVVSMPLIPFTFYSLAGATLWTSLLTFLGYKLGEHYTLVEEYIGPISKIVLVSIVIFGILWIINKKMKSQT